ncbi:MAG: carboxypeptidase-like regulatory domain-containing protein, partial [Vicinamibacteria bacterium]
MRRRSTWVVGVPLLVALFTAAPPPIAAQTFRGGIRGSVADSSGAAAPGATVTATNLDTGLARTAVTDAAGNYAFSELPLG